MKLLIIEDDEIKRNELMKYISSSIPSATIETAKSYQSGLKAIIAKQYKIIILDMTMPTFDIGLEEPGGRPQAYAGREILRQMDRRDIKIPVIVVTQFDRFGEGKDKLTLEELDGQLKMAHPMNYKGSVYYNTTSDSWKSELLSTLKNIIG